MKKFTFIFAALFAATFANAQQVTFQHSFVGEDINFVTYDYSLNKSLYYSDNINELYGNAYYACIFDTTTYTIKRYNTDYTLNSTKVFNIPQVPEYKASSSLQISKTIFDDDPNTYELVVTYHKINSSYRDQDRNSCYIARVYREDGTLVADLGTAYSLYVYPYLHIYDNEYRFYVRRTNYANTAYTQGVSDEYVYSYDIYKVNKKNTNGLQQVPKDNLPKKVLIEGKVYIIVGERVIDVLGREIK